MSHVRYIYIYIYIDDIARRFINIVSYMRSCDLKSFDFSAIKSRNHTDREGSALELGEKMQILRQC